MLDLLVYLPAGVLLTAVEDTSGAVSKGRARVDQELRNAEFVGRLAVELGLRQLKGRIESLAAESSGTSPSAAPPSRTSPSPAPPSRTSPSHTSHSATSRPRTEHRAPSLHGNTMVDRVIPDYDILAASQVVRRLDGLDDDELRSVLRYEQATRARRTILQHVEQLLDRPGGVADGGRPTEPGSVREEPTEPGSAS